MNLNSWDTSSRPVSGMILIDCSELDVDEKLALASTISDEMGGRVLALVKGKNIVLDVISGEKPEVLTVRSIVSDFISSREDGSHYSLDVSGDRIVVHPADPIPALRRKPERELPPNVRQCPFCGFITEYDELYMVHVRAHGAGV